MIIAFSGKKQSGKDTAVNDIAKRVGWSGCLNVSFAGYLKEIVSRCYNVSRSQMETEEGKSKVLKNGRTVRELLQYLGTDVMREIDEDCWVNAYKDLVQLEADRLTILTADVRFPNEVEAIQAMGGFVIRLTRSPFADSDLHVSETALDDFVEPGGSVEFDYVLDNSQMSIEEQNAAVWKIITERGLL